MGNRFESDRACMVFDLGMDLRDLQSELKIRMLDFKAEPHQWVFIPPSKIGVYDVFLAIRMIEIMEFDNEYEVINDAVDYFCNFDAVHLLCGIVP